MGLEPQLANRWDRFFGRIVDLTAVIAICVPIVFIARSAQLITLELPFSISQNILFLFIGQIVFLTLNGYLLAKKGQTIGKKMFSIRVLSNSGDQVISFSRLYFLRYLLIDLIVRIPLVGTIFALIDSLFIFREDKRCIHDLIAGTKVVKA